MSKSDALFEPPQESPEAIAETVAGLEAIHTKLEETDAAKFDLLKKHDAKVREAAMQCGVCKAEWDAAKAEATEKKKLYSAACSFLVELAKERPSHGPLFESGSVNLATGEMVNDAWREVSLTALEAHGAPAGAIAKLCARSPAMDTLGRLTDWMNKKGQWWAKDLKCGIGEETAAKFADAFTGWYSAHPEMGGGIRGLDAPAAPDDAGEFEEAPE